MTASTRASVQRTPRGRPTDGAEPRYIVLERRRRRPAGETGAEVHEVADVARGAGLSQSSVRRYQRAGLVGPSGRHADGSPRYTDEDVERLGLIRGMKPLGFTVNDMRELLELRDRLAAGGLGSDDRRALLGRLAEYASLASERCVDLEMQAQNARVFTQALQRQVEDLRAPEPRRRSTG